MKYLELNRIEKLYFGHEEIARILGISKESAKVAANRYVKKGILIRLKRNVYVLKDKWISLYREQKFILANVLQVPSYISLMTALDYYEITTQMQQDFIESIAVNRTKEQAVENTVFNFIKINKKLYFGFRKEKGFFIALPEKAFLDAIYLKSLGRYNFDRASLDVNKLNMDKFKQLARSFPIRTQKLIEKNEYI